MAMLKRQVPALAWIPLAMLLLGIGETLKSIVIAKAVFVPVVMNTNSGIQPGWAACPSCVVVAEPFRAAWIGWACNKLLSYQAAKSAAAWPGRTKGESRVIHRLGERSLASEAWREACPTIFRFRDQNIFLRNE
jgi:hypothetical protein